MLSHVLARTYTDIKETENTFFGRISHFVSARNF